MPGDRHHTDPEVRFLLTSIDEAFDRKSWHGPNLRGAIRGLSLQGAAWRPHPHDVYHAGQIQLLKRLCQA